jgi:hypothetical protein
MVSGTMSCGELCQPAPARIRRAMALTQWLICTSLGLIQRSMSDYVIHSTAGMIGKVDSMLSRTRASLAPAEPVP